MSPCIICYTDDNGAVFCQNCKDSTCISCLNIYKKLECPSCSEEYSDLVFKPFYKKNKDLYINYYIYKNLKYDDKMNLKVINYFKKMEIKQKIYWGERINIEGTTAFASCKKCSGIILETGICLKCKFRICVKCEEEYHEDKECSKEAMDAIKEIRKTCKKCPCCYAYIYRIDGCSHMNCSYCGASFDWNNPDIIQKDQYKYKQIKDIYINKELYDKYTKEYETLYKKKSNFTNKSELAVITNCCTENIEIFVLNLSRDYKEIKKNIDKLSVEYFSLIKNELETHQDEEYTQIDVNYFINKKFMNKLYTVLKKKEYFLEINKKMEGFQYQDKNNLEQIFTEIKDNFIIPEDILFFFDKDGVEIVNNKTRSLKKKIKKEKVYEYDELEDKKKIVLLNEEQEKHVEGVYNILKKYKMCLNTSHAGSGKTYTSLYIANKLNISTLIVFSPKIMEYKWTEVIRKYNQTYKFNTIQFTYSEISSPNFTINNNVYKTVLQNNRIAIEICEDFINKLTPSCMIIFDEIHNIKSSSSKSFKFIEQLSFVAFTKGSYILSLSATPIEKAIEICQLSKKISLLIKFDNIPFDTDPFIPYNKGKPVLPNIEDNTDVEIKEETEDSKTFSEIESVIEKEKGDISVLYKQKTSILYENDEDLNKPSTSKSNVVEKEYNILDTPLQDEAKALDPLIEFRKREVEDIIRSLCLSIRRNYNNLIRYFNQSDFRRRRINFVIILKNIINSNINPIEITRKIIKDRIIKKRPVFINNDVLKFINSQSNFKIYFILLYKYVLYISRSIKKYSFGDKITLTSFLLILYGFDISDSINLVIRFNINSLAEVFKEQLFNMKTFNILATLNRKRDIDLCNTKLLDITLRGEDIERLDSAFKQVLIKIDTEDINTLETFSLITKGLIISELVYVNYITEIILNIIENNIKIIIGLHYKETMKRFKSIFNEIGIEYISIDGSVSNKEVLINSFQNNKNKKLLIVNIKSINTGIDLDDKKGNEKRVVFIIPDFKFSETIQFMYRFKRLDSKSEPTIFLINNHMKILNVLLKKNVINKKLNTSLPDLGSLEKITENNILTNILS
jgi:superfamily II DNA or RNA helicase